MADLIHLVSSFRQSFGTSVAPLANQGEGARILSTAGQALCLLGPGGDVLSSTPPFQQLIGDVVHVFNGRMRAARRHEDASLQTVLSALTSAQFYDDAPLAVARLTRKDGTTLVVHGISIVGGNSLAGSVPVALVVFDAPRVGANGEEALMEAFGLTSAEARLAARLCAGHSLRRAATEEAITYETARSRLKAIFRKTDTTRQAELVLLLARFR